MTWTLKKNIEMQAPMPCTWTHTQCRIRIDLEQTARLQFGKISADTDNTLYKNTVGSAVYYTLHNFHKTQTA